MSWMVGSVADASNSITMAPADASASHQVWALHARSRFKSASREYGIANAMVGAMRRGASERAVVAASTRPPPPTREGRGEWVGFAR